MSTFHKQVRIKHDQWTAQIDKAIAPLVLELWRAGIATAVSCEDFETAYGWDKAKRAPGKVVWVVFPTAEDARRFAAIGRGYAWPTPQKIRVSNADVAKATENRHLVGTLTYHVRFLRRDLRAVVAAIRSYNASRIPR